MVCVQTSKDVNLSPKSKSRLIFIISAFFPCLVYPLPLICLEPPDDHREKKKTDIYLEKTVSEELNNDSRVSPYGLTVTVDNGEVTLQGQVDDLHARQAAEQSIRCKIGVRQVKNLIQLRRKPQQADDTDLAGMVEESIRRNPYVYNYEISVSVSDGRVVLSGVVGSAFEKDQAGRAASGVKGVTAVYNWINVSPDKLFTASSSLKLSDSTWQMISKIDSIYLSGGLQAPLIISLNSNYWSNSLAKDIVPYKKKNIYGNPETGYREYFNFMGLGVFLIKKIIGK
jgi:osmotically-inducible protein OsmY